MTDAIETVLFDLDGTLCEYRQDAAAVLESAFERAGVSPTFTASDYHARYGDYLEASTDVHDLRVRCFGDLAADAGHDREIGRRVAEAFAEVRDQRAVDLMPGAREVVAAVGADDRYRLGLVTNGDPGMQRQKLAAAGFDDAFETVVYAGYDTAAKPDAEPFEVALEALESAPSSAVYVGNSLSSDVAGARAAGVRSVWVPDDGTVPDRPEPKPDYVLESLSEFETLPWV
ncbi:HAD family hydrolase [Natrononativus amylolyticus]|uniref:HAD family hydrolase n=1 Tax=Natrononativus amylolyticus TaxID=2963434 RepID=UPI0020CBC5CC|nr:HAD family hydrolase [Natrononativus amylolyticus]